MNIKNRYDSVHCRYKSIAQKSLLHGYTCTVIIFLSVSYNSYERNFLVSEQLTHCLI